MPVLAGLSVLLLAIAFYVYRNNVLFQIPLFVTVTLLLFYIVNLASAAWALNQASAFYESSRVFLATASVLLFYVVFENKLLEKKIFRLFALGSLVVTAIAIWQYIADAQDNGAVLGHKNLLASFLVLSVAIAVYLCFDSDKKQRTLSVVLVAIFLVVLLILRVRSSYLALLAGLFCFAISQAAYTKKSNRSLIVSIVVLAALLLLPLLPGFERLGISSFKHSDSGVERIKLWQKTWQLFLEKPLLGVGAGNWQFMYQKFGVGDIDAVRNSGITFQRPHNDFLWVLSETGLLGFVLLLIVLVYTGIKFHKSQSLQSNPSTLALFSALMALMTDAFFSLDKERPLIILFAAILFAALLRKISLPFELQKTKRTVVVIAIATGLSFGLAVALFRINGEYHTQQLLLSKNNNDLTQMSIHGRKALSVFYTCDPTSTPIASYVGYAYERMNRADSMLVFTEQAYHLAPYDYEVLNNYGMMMARAGQLAKAEELLREAYRINPYFEVTRLNLAVTAYNRRKFIEAKQWLITLPNYQKHYPAQSAAIMTANN